MNFNVSNQVAGNSKNCIGADGVLDCQAAWQRWTRGEVRLRRSRRQLSSLNSFNGADDAEYSDDFGDAEMPSLSDAEYSEQQRQQQA